MVANALRSWPRAMAVLVVLAVVGEPCSTTPRGFASTTTADIGPTTATGTGVEQSDTAEGDSTTPNRAANQFNVLAGKESLAGISPPVIVVQVNDLGLTDRQGSLIALEATVVEVA